VDLDVDGLENLSRCERWGHVLEMSPVGECFNQGALRSRIVSFSAMAKRTFLTTAQLCERLHITKYGLLAARRQKIDPMPYLRIGRKILYDEDEVFKWMQRQAKRDRLTSCR
jgi:hypothetical protein